MAIMYTAERDMNLDTYEGYVLEKIHDNSYRIMSDVWGSADFALVWDEKTNSPKNICVNVYDMNPESWRPVEIVVDAPAEVRAKYLNWRTEIEYRDLVDKAESAAAEIQKGCIAKVVKGKSGKGTVGKVVVQMLASYGMGYRASSEYKLAIALSEEKIQKPLRNGKIAEVYKDVVWVWARNCVRVDIAQIDKDALLQAAKERAVRHCKAG